MEPSPLARRGRTGGIAATFTGREKGSPPIVFTRKSRVIYYGAQTMQRNSDDTGDFAYWIEEMRAPTRLVDSRRKRRADPSGSARPPRFQDRQPRLRPPKKVPGKLVRSRVSATLSAAIASSRRAGVRAWQIVDAVVKVLPCDAEGGVLRANIPWKRFDQLLEGKGTELARL